MVRFALAVVLALFASVTTAQDVKTYIPGKAQLYFPLVVENQHVLPAGFPSIAYIGSLIEVESCISLKHRRCWDPTSELLTKREQGTGLTQITRAFRADGSVRFDTLADLRAKYREHLGELSWDNIKTQPGLQIRAGMLLISENYRSLHYIADPTERLRMSDSAYNRGIGNLIKDRRACGLAKDCNPQIWFGNVEKYCVGPNAVLYGNRTACQINRHHVLDATVIRLPKYERAVSDLLEKKSAQ